MKEGLGFAVLLGLCLAVGAAFRLPALDRRPMHADEAVQVVRSSTLWLAGRYVYDPDEFHGPTLAYATRPVLQLLGAQNLRGTTEAFFRVVPVLFGIGLIALAAMLTDALGKHATLFAAAATAISPAMVYYSRYYIHETLLVFFTLGLIAAAWRYAQSRRLVWCLMAGAFAGLMQATKETSVLAFASAAAAWAMISLGRHAFGGERPATAAPNDTSGSRLPTPDSRLTELPATAAPNDTSGSRLSTLDSRLTAPVRWWHLFLGLGTAVLIAAVFLSSFFTNLRGPLDGVLTYLPWLQRAAGRSLHTHPWYYYANILSCWRVDRGPLSSEGLLVGLAVAGAIVAYWPKAAAKVVPHSSFVRWLTLYALLLTAAYSVIPYKTPWCLLSFLQAMILLAGFGAAAIVRLVPTRPLKALTVLALLAASGQLAWQSYRASYLLFADPRNPYVYAHTLPDAIRLAGDVEQLTQASPEGRGLLVQVVWQDAYYWPLPWYFRGLDRVGYWTSVPDDVSASVIISSPQYDEDLTRKLDATHIMTSYYALRPGVFAQLWVRTDLWEAHLRRLGRL